MSTKQFYIPFPTAFNSNGLAVPGAKFYFYLPGTTTLTSVYSDAALAVPAANPVVTDGAGRLPNLYLNGDLQYRLKITDASGTLLEDLDPFIPGTFYGPPLPVTVTSAAGQSVSTRGLLAGIASPVNNQTAYLAETNREGWFKFNTANLSAGVTADPAQAVYVAPASATSGASGAWVRVNTATLNVQWFGAVGDGVTDDQLALQRAINYAFTLPEATLDFPDGIYLVGGSEDATTHGMLTFPLVSSGPSKHIRFIGRGRAGTPAFGVPTNGAVIKSTVAGSNIDSAVISAHAWDPTRGVANFNRVYPHFENITIRTTDNPTRGGLQFSNCLSFSAKNVNIDTGTDLSVLSQPTNNRCGIWLPLVDNYGFISAQDTFVTGYKTGMRISEHAHLKSYFYRCMTAVECQQGFHLNFGYIEVEHCPKVIDFTGIATVDFDVNFERWDVPASGAGAVWWQSAGTDLNEVTAANARGAIRYKITIASVGDTILPLGSNTSRTLSVQNLFTPWLGANVYALANQTLTNNTLTAVGFGGEVYDMIGGSNNSITAFHRTDTNTGRFTFDRAGIADITADLVFAVNTTGLRQLVLRKNGTTPLVGLYATPVTGDATTVHYHGRFEVVAGDYIEILGLQTSGGNLDLSVSGETKSRATLEFRPYA